MATAGQSLTDVQQRDEFHRVIALHYENVADLLRELTIYKLSQNNKSTIQIFKKICLAELKKHATKKIINQSQLKILNSPSSGLNDMDVTMLTMCLLNCGNVVSLDPSETKLIKSLRELRNDIAHNLTGRLSDKTLFNKTGQYCIQLSQNLPAPFQHSLKASIDELKQREFVRRISTLEILKINVEQLEVVLLQHEERDDEGDTLNVIILKYNLAKWAKQISREINIDILLKALKKKKVIQKDVYRRITEVKCECDKAPMLIDHFIKEKSRLDILRLLDEFRASNKALIADLIENNNSDGRNTQKAFMDELMKTLKGLLIANVRKIEGKSETAEDLHAFIEEHLGYQLDFNIVDDAVHSVFTIRVKDKRYNGLCVIVAESKPEQKSENTEGNTNIAAMSLDQYADFVGSKFSYVDEKICQHISSRIKNSFTKMEDFINLSDADLTELFGPRPINDETTDDIRKNDATLMKLFDTEQNKIQLKFGIKKVFENIQVEIKSSMNIKNVVTDQRLRPFNRQFGSNYEQCEFYYNVSGNLHEPAHEFFQPNSRQISRYFIMKTSVKFIAACINGRKNGTIHYGLKRLDRNKGEIIGMQIDDKVLDSIDSIIDEGIDRCVRNENEKTKMRTCVKPAYVIPVTHKERLFVIEIDILPNFMYLGKDPILFEVKFPPTGPQELTIFILDDKDNCEIGIITHDHEDDIKEVIRDLNEERQKLDLQAQLTKSSSYELSQLLIQQLTRNADYITDEFYPIICASKIKDSSQIKNLGYQGLKDAFQNSNVVFDFNSSTELLGHVEDGTQSFLVKTVDEYDLKHNAFDDQDRLWIYCNGYADKKVQVFDKMAWNLKRLNKMEFILNQMKPHANSRAKCIMLIFQEIDMFDPMIEFATAIFTRHFQDRCLIIGETAAALNSLEQVLSEKVGTKNVQPYVFHGLDWESVCKVFSSVFKENTSNTCMLPNSQGTSDEISQKEREKWKNIEIVGMDECTAESKEMTSEDRQIKMKEEQERFYKGHKASWWNFFFEHHGTREVFSKCRNIIEDTLTRQDRNPVEIVELKHYPGAGGSTLGRHLIWHFSQKRCCLKPYRCCIVKDFKENTINDIGEFRSFRDKAPRPVIILLDLETHDTLFHGLDKLAKRTASTGELFALVIKISRVSLSEDSETEAAHGRGSVALLQHQLQPREKEWFNANFQQLENSNIDVSTLLAFNFMRHEFEPRFMKDTVENIMRNGVPSEIEILKTLAVVCAYETGRLVPESVFDNVWLKKNV